MISKWPLYIDHNIDQLIVIMLLFWRIFW